ncbi:hypothetical protein HanPI659440_Chr15g0614391 [Helianthus annuus]|nr:hypothetical protein HanPI659440_Chr15g0614391 [Helianthus annuus]
MNLNYTSQSLTQNNKDQLCSPQSFMNLNYTCQSLTQNKNLFSFCIIKLFLNNISYVYRVCIISKIQAISHELFSIKYLLNVNLLNATTLTITIVMLIIIYFILFWC